jgi:hypothetical protein
MIAEIRRLGTHLGASSKQASNSSLRPPLGRTQIVDFGAERQSGSPRETQIKEGVVEEQLHFENVPAGVVEDIKSSDTYPEVRQVDSVIGDKQAEQDSIPAIILCDVYFSLVERWISEVGSAAGIVDSFDGINEVVWDE